MDEVIRKQIATWCRNVWAITSEEHISMSDAVERAGVPEAWRILITCLLLPGYEDMPYWVSDQG